MTEVDWGHPRPPRPGAPPTEGQVAAMTRAELFAVASAAVEHHQRSPRALTPKQQAQYDAWWKLFRTYFSPSDAIDATRRYVESGHDSYWTGRPTPVEGHAGGTQ
ncbi:hypothetical protein [Phytohabitans houttuyneae]|uniref:Uncharacterized protein n=1 Tax=Phytohabitans houttuyneae TaxID=1076126 RepID=A0A6V8K0S9_9ACTN|nr:hypothetical protein [Phytohabitans houttuyneae]GFJ77264.1 hypothetical protein Phou_014440 [Phytohabitans houttuyneae]